MQDVADGALRPVELLLVPVVLLAGVHLLMYRALLLHHVREKCLQVSDNVAQTMGGMGIPLDQAADEARLRCPLLWVGGLIQLHISKTVHNACKNLSGVGRGVLVLVLVRPHQLLVIVTAMRVQAEVNLAITQQHLRLKKRKTLLFLYLNALLSTVYLIFCVNYLFIICALFVYSM